MPWSPISFFTSWCWSPWCGCASCSMGYGQATVLRRTRHHLNPCHHGASAAASRNPLQASPARRTATPVSRSTSTAPSRPVARPPHRAHARPPAPGGHVVALLPQPPCASRGWVGLGNIRANGLPTICQPEFVTFFAPSALPAYNESGWHHSTYDDAAWT